MSAFFFIILIAGINPFIDSKLFSIAVSSDEREMSGHLVI
jgi:hypothetical protein